MTVVPGIRLKETHEISQRCQESCRVANVCLAITVRTLHYTNSLDRNVVWVVINHLFLIP
jgi:hypothetical protein